MNDDLLPAQIAALRRMTLAERFERGLRFLRLTREWLAAGVRARHPDWPEPRVREETRRLIDRARD
jgi:hypothetical protein